MDILECDIGQVCAREVIMLQYILNILIFITKICIGLIPIRV